MRFAVLALSAIALGALGAAPAGAAQVERRIVTVATGRTGVVIAPTKAVDRKDRGRVLAVHCARRPFANADVLPWPDGYDRWSSHQARIRPGLTIRVRGSSADYCRAEVRRPRADNPTQRFVVTEQGAIWIRRLDMTQWLDAAISVAVTLHPRSLPPAAELVAPPSRESEQLMEEFGMPRERVLERPDAWASEGEMGIWTEGGTRILVTATVAGERLYIDRDLQSMRYATNLSAELRDLANEGDNWIYELPGRPND